MTLWVKRSEHNPKHIEVHVTSGSVEVKVTEDVGHLRHVWHDLGMVLNEAEAGERAAVAPDEHAQSETG